ncbi:MAG: DUF6786 family protein [Bryobacteraceae bacterium]
MAGSLIEVLREAGKNPESVTFADGTRVLLLPHGGRVLGLFAAGSEENFYWTNPALRSAESARALYEGDAWQNSGGDRTWLAPELDFFFPQYPNIDLSTYRQQRALDPGNYQVVSTGGLLSLVNRLTLTMSRGKRCVDLEISKSVFPAPNPLRYEPGFQDMFRNMEVEYAGYTQKTALALPGGGENSPRVGLWNLIQMPHNGDLLIPTYSKASVKIYMGSAGGEDLIVTDRLVKYRMRAKGEHKIGLRAENMCGRAGYLCAASSQSALVIRNFSVNPSGEYVDVPWTEPDNFGFAVQACNVDSHLGSFSELEYHVPAIGGPGGSSRCEEISQVWAFRGRPDAIHHIAQVLLSPEV